MILDDIIIANLGIPSKELFEIKDRDLNFYMLGSMGLVSSIGLGLAIIQEKHVYVIDGDGSLLMNPNALISIGDYASSKPDNYCNRQCSIWFNREPGNMYTEPGRP